MKEHIIEIMKYAGYDFIEEKPKDRLIFYDVTEEQNVQLWLTVDLNGDYENALHKCVNLIYNRAKEYGINIGKSNIIGRFKQLMDLD